MAVAKALDIANSVSGQVEGVVGGGFISVQSTLILPEQGKGPADPSRGACGSVEANDASTRRPLTRLACAWCSQPRYWTPEEHRLFMEAVQRYGWKDVKSIAQHVGTRTPTQVRTHAQKLFLRQQKESSGVMAPAKSGREMPPGIPLPSDGAPASSSTSDQLQVGAVPAARGLRSPRSIVACEATTPPRRALPQSPGALMPCARGARV